MSTLNELDAMLNDLGRAEFSANPGYDPPPKSVNSSYGYGGDYSDYSLFSELSNDHLPPSRPPPPRGYSPEMELKVKRPPPPKNYEPPVSPATRRRGGEITPNGTLRLPKPLKPPRLQHILVKKRHDLVKKVPRNDGIMRVDVYESEDDAEPSHGDVTEDEIDYDYGTLKSTMADVSEDELENVDAGETPRGDKSMVIHTMDRGDLKSKYHYLGFGLWENTDPTKQRKIRKPDPPSPPPKDEPIWYNCTVAVESHKTSKELDDLFHDLDGYDRMPAREVEVGNLGANLPGDLGDLYEAFEKEDMSEMFRRAFLEKLALTDDAERAKHRCHVCSEWICGRIITAMGKKFHPQCFVCTYCRKGFKERSFRSDRDLRPYCHPCFEKLLGHFGTAHFAENDFKELPRINV